MKTLTWISCIVAVGVVILMSHFVMSRAATLQDSATGQPTSDHKDLQFEDADVNPQPAVRAFPGDEGLAEPSFEAPLVAKESVESAEFADQTSSPDTASSQTGFGMGMGSDMNMYGGGSMGGEMGMEMGGGGGPLRARRVTRNVAEIQWEPIPIDELAELRQLQRAIQSLKTESAKTTPDESVRQQAIATIRQNLTSQFERDLKWRERELMNVEKRLTALRGQLVKRRSAQSDIINLKLQTLVNQAIGLAFPDDAVSGGGVNSPWTNGLNSSGMGGMPGAGGPNMGGPGMGVPGGPGMGLGSVGYGSYGGEGYAPPGNSFDDGAEGDASDVLPPLKN